MLNMDIATDAYPHATPILVEQSLNVEVQFNGPMSLYTELNGSGYKFITW